MSLSTMRKDCNNPHHLEIIEKVKMEKWDKLHLIDMLKQERRNSIANALE